MPDPVFTLLSHLHREVKWQITGEMKVSYRFLNHAPRQALPDCLALEDGTDR
jgi:hypothetical protein